MDQFRRHKIKVLVATDLAARGIDVSKISHIINYDIPLDPEIYVHRIGRTARMGHRGTAITFVTPEEGKELTNVEVLINREIPSRTVPGFTPSKPKEPEERPPRHPDASRDNGATSAATTTAPAKARPKTLASKFRTSKRRRRL